TGSMNDLTKHATYWLAEGDQSPFDVGFRLNEIPMSALANGGARYGKPPGARPGPGGGRDACSPLLPCPTSLCGAAGPDRCRGLRLGLAAGDRNGGPIRMAARLAESLLELGRFNPQDIVGRYLRWWREGAFDTGPVSGRALELMAAGVSVQKATAQVHREFGG